MSQVPNKFPRISPSGRRLAVVGEAPGVEEVVAKEPFVGTSGRFLRLVLGSLQMSADQCFIGNVCQIRPPNNDIEEFEFEGPEVQTGLTQLNSDLHEFNPNCILLLGRTAFRAFNPTVCYFDAKGRIQIPLSNWRGSIFTDGEGRKCVGTFHPAYILRAYSDSGLFRFDVARAVSHSASRDFQRPERRYITRPSIADVISICDRILASECTIAFDIEGISNHIGVTMLSLFTSPNEGIVIPFWLGGSHYWSHEEEILVWRAVGKVLSSPLVRKITQNGLYELFVLLWRHKIVVVNITEDTMLKHWELFPEFEKSLALQASLYTLEPYYKDDRLSGDPETQLIYNAKDSAVTFECALAQDPLLRNQPKSEAHYRFNVRLLPAFAYMSLRGVKVDVERLNQKIALIDLEIGELQSKVDSLILDAALAADVLTRKRKSDPWHFNVKSSDQKNWLLYDYFGYTPYARKGKVADEETLHRYYAKGREPLIRLIIQLVSKRTRASDLRKLVSDADGRIRSGYNPVGTVTGRLSSSNSSAVVPYFTAKGLLKWEFTGTNLQNQTKDVREVFVADPEFWFFQCDLTGADAWTVAADLAALGHPTMLEDLKAGIKPAKVLLAMLSEYEAGRDPAAFNQLPRDVILLRTAELKIPKGILDDGRPGDWKYTCMKRVQHGTNYGMRPELLSSTIFKDSDGLIDLPTKDAEFYQFLYRLRYNPDARSAWIRSELQRKGYIETAAGIRRKFYGLRGPTMVDDAILREALSTEPQANTTYIINRGLEQIWYDPTNRTSKGGLFIEPLIQIHDAIAGQFRKKHLEWARGKIKEMMSQEITIHGITLRIPFEAKYGTDWLNLNEDL